MLGDDVQYLVAWYWCLKACVPASGVTLVTIEARDAGNVDDVVVDFGDGHTLFHQVKTSVSAAHVADTDWMIGTTSNSKKSLLQRLYETWSTTLGRPNDGVLLVSSRPIDRDDLVFAGLDRMNKVGNHLRRATGALATVRAQLAAHVGCSEEEICGFFDVLEIHLGQTEAAWRDKVEDAALAAGVRFDDAARAAGLDFIREWVKTTRDPRDADEIRRLIDGLKLRAEAPRALVTIEALEPRPASDDADYRLTWVDHFSGDTPETRRGVADPEAWNMMAGELATLRKDLQERGTTRVVVRGQMRMPCWFAAGAALREVAGFDVAARYGDEVWPADAQDTAKPEVAVVADAKLDGAEDEVALVMSMSADATRDATAHFENGPVGRLLSITVGAGPDRRLFGGPADAMAAAVACRDWVRANLQGKRIHLIIAGPAPFAFFLGHLWDRVPPTTIYEDLAPGYEPAFTFTNKG